MYHTYQITQILDVSPHLYMEASMCPGPCGNGSSVTINSKVDQSTDVVRWGLRLHKFKNFKGTDKDLVASFTSSSKVPGKLAYSITCHASVLSSHLVSWVLAVIDIPYKPKLNRFWHWPHSMRNSIYETVRYPSVCLSQHKPTGANPLLQVCFKGQQVCCCGPGGQEISINCYRSSVWRANADSAMLNTDLLVVAIAVSTVRLCVRAVLAVRLCPFVRHKSLFYRNGWADRADLISEANPSFGQYAEQRARYFFSLPVYWMF